MGALVLSQTVWDRTGHLRPSFHNVYPFCIDSHKTSLHAALKFKVSRARVVIKEKIIISYKSLRNSFSKSLVNNVGCSMCLHKTIKCALFLSRPFSTSSENYLICFMRVPLFVFRFTQEFFLFQSANGFFTANMSSLSIPTTAKTFTLWQYYAISQISLRYSFFLYLFFSQSCTQFLSLWNCHTAWYILSPLLYVS